MSCMLVITSKGISRPFIENIVESLKNLIGDVSLVDPATVSKSDIHIELDYNSKNAKLIGNFNVLILFEPKTVLPRQYKKSILNKFDLIIPLGNIRAKNLGLNYWAPYPYNFVINKFNENLRIKNVVMVNSAKFSSNRSSLYGLRRIVSKELNSLEIGFDLIGDNWKMSKLKEFRERIWAIRKDFKAGNLISFKEAFSEFFYTYPEYIGRCDNKIETMSHYKYALVIENEGDFISEKLLDAIAARCVPIYVGDNLSDFKKLREGIILMDPDKNKIIDFFKKDNDKLYLYKKQFIDNPKNYIDDIMFFSVDNSSKIIAEIIANKVISNK